MLILLPPSETKRAGGRRGRSTSHARAALARAAARGRDRRARRAVGRRGRRRARPQARRHAARRGRGQRRAAHRADDAGRSTATPASSTTRWTRHPSTRRPAAGSARHVAHPLGAVRPGRRARPIPAYRLGAAASLPGLPPLTRVWADAVSRGARRRRRRRFVLDLRSEAYAALGPVPASRRVRSTCGSSRDGDGERSARSTTSTSTRRARSCGGSRSERPRVASRAGFVRWADAAGLRVRDGAPGELELFA